jgi:tetratricopeptide (TPR) repeat protein
MHIVRSLLALIIVAAVVACASTPLAGPEAVARLEQARAANPRSAPVLRSLGIAYYKSGRLPEARAALDQAVRLDPRDGTAALYLGLTAEAQNDLSVARAAYGSYVRHGRTSRVRRALEARLAALQRREIEQTAKAQIREELRLAAVPGAPNVVAVMPLSFSGADTSLKPLERGFAELLTVDLARSSRLTVVERMRIQAVIDELKLQQAGGTDSSSNVRAGRILQAGRLVQGSILQSGQQLRVDAAVVDVPTTRVAGSTNDDQRLEQLLTLEKNIALGLFPQLGVTLTTAERNAIEQRPTRSLAAFLAYSRGLLREDESQFNDADRFYQEAIRLDPGFAAAQQRSQETQNIIAGSQVTSASIEAGLSGTEEGRIVEQATAGLAVGAGSSEGSTAMLTAADLNPSSIGAAAVNAAGALTSPPLRDPVAAGIGIENPGRTTARIEIVIRRP